MGSGEPTLRTGANVKHTQAELVKYAADLGIQGQDFVTVMTNGGFKNADLQAMTRWEEMVQAIDIVAGKVATPGM